MTILTMVYLVGDYHLKVADEVRKALLLVMAIYLRR